MLATRDLALDQAPPILVPLRFFLTAPLFVAAGGLLIAVEGDAVFQSRWTPAAVALTHLITLGFLAQVMIGATLQLLPVLAGAAVARPSTVSGVLQALFLAGATALIFGLYTEDRFWLLTGGPLLACGFALFLTVTAAALLGQRSSAEIRWSLALSWAALVPTLALGLLLVLGLAGRISLVDFAARVNLHLTWGLLGWVGLTLVGVVFELVPMFYMTPRPGSPLVPAIVVTTFVALLAVSLLSGLHADTGVALASGAMVLVFAALAVIWLTWRRRRPILDTTLLYLWVGCAGVVAAVLGWALGLDSVLVGILALGGVALSFPSGMLYKIVPFLCWLHLQTEQVATRQFDHPLPQMKDFIPEHWARWQLVLFVGALTCLLLGHSGVLPVVALGGVLLMGSALLMWTSLLGAVWRYRRERACLRGR